jgi:hypothetical protein
MSSPIIVTYGSMFRDLILLPGDSMVTKVKPELNSVRIHPQVSGISKLLMDGVLVIVGSHTLLLWSLVVFHPHIISLCLSLIQFLSVKILQPKKAEFQQRNDP